MDINGHQNELNLDKMLNFLNFCYISLGSLNRYCAYCVPCITVSTYPSMYHFGLEGSPLMSVNVCYDPKNTSVVTQNPKKDRTLADKHTRMFAQDFGLCNAILRGRLPLCNTSSKAGALPSKVRIENNSD